MEPEQLDELKKTLDNLKKTPPKHTHDEHPFVGTLYIRGFAEVQLSRDKVKETVKKMLSTLEKDGVVIHAVDAGDFYSERVYTTQRANDWIGAK